MSDGASEDAGVPEELVSRRDPDAVMQDSRPQDAAGRDSAPRDPWLQGLYGFMFTMACGVPGFAIVVFFFGDGGELLGPVLVSGAILVEAWRQKRVSEARFTPFLIGACLAFLLLFVISWNLIQMLSQL